MVSPYDVDITEELSKNLESCVDTFRSLYGLVVRDCLKIVGSTLGTGAFPNGYSTLGVFSADPEADGHTLISNSEKRLESIRESLEVLDVTHFLLLTVKEGTLIARMVHRDSLSEMEHSQLRIRKTKSLPGVLFRSRSALPLSVEYNGNQAHLKTELGKSVKTCCNFLSPECLMFELEGSYMKYNDRDTTLADFLRDWKINTESVETVEVHAQKVMSGVDVVKNSDIKHTPVIHMQKMSIKCFRFDLRLDVVSFLPFEATVAQAVAILTNTMFQQAVDSVDVISSSASPTHLTPCVPLHFKPNHTYMTALYPGGKPSLVLKQSLHKDHLLSQDRPLFSSGQAVFFAQDTPVYRNVLQNTHSRLKLPSKTSRMGIVKGDYLYYHYMQQKFDDSGWGCAYRSLQTLCSWFKLQGFTECDVPDHKKIQETLVQIGDKQSGFIGSKQWIGSQEVSFVLNQIMKVDSKTIFVASGAELPSKASELISHFEIHGTPVMIGGGQLAHTILGVAVNEENDETQFLILDPHYTGGEDISVVNGKGWCNWKAASFWDRTAFYNMCLPQVPRNVY